VEFKLLGSLEVRDRGQALALGGVKQRALLAVLLLRANQVVSRDRLIDELWGEGSPPNAGHRLETVVSRLRQAVGLGQVLVTRAGGYVLMVDPDRVDAHRFEQLLDRGRAANASGRPGEAAVVLGEALSLWRGEVLGDLAYLPFARFEAERLEELRLAAVEERVEARLALGEHRAVISELEGLTVAEPLRERPRGQLMLALYRSGRQADALEAYRCARAYLAEELGLEPGPELKALQARILAHAPELEPAPRDGPAIPMPTTVLSRLRDSRLFGRRVELSRCAAESQRVGRGEQRTVLIAGEPGIGKTRLAAELASKLHAEGMTVLWGRCDPDLGLPYQPFVEILAHFARFSPQRVWADQGARYVNELARLVPELAGSVSPGLTPAEQSDGAHRHVMFAAVETVLRNAALERPLALIVDDLQWADKPTVLLLRYLLLASQPMPAMVVATYRSTEQETQRAVDTLLADLRRQPGVEWLTLGGIPPEHAIEMAQDLAQEPLDPAGARLVRGLWEQTDGNPFFIGEIVRSLNESGGVNRAGRALAAGGRPAVIMPTSVRETIAARVRRMGARAAQVLSAAAVIGTEFDVELLAQACHTEEDQLAEVLDCAAAAALITELPGTGMRYAFEHQLIALALYDALGAARRRVMHAGVLEGLERLLGDHERHQRIGEFARHALNGVPIVAAGKSVEYARLAGERALEQLAPQEAKRWFEEALTSQERSARDGTRDDRDQRHCDVLIGRGIAQLQVGDPDFRATLLRAGALARRRGDGDQLVRAALGNARFFTEFGKVDVDRVEMLEAALATVGHADSASRARLLALLACELTSSGDWQRRRELSDESLAIATRLGDPRTVSDVLKQRFLTIWTPATLAQRIVETDRQLAIAEELNDPVAVFYALHWRAAAAVEAGELNLARELGERQTELAQRLRLPTLSFIAAYPRFTLALARGRLEKAEQSVEEVWRLAADIEQPETTALVAGEMLNLRFEQGRLAELEPLIAEQVEANPGIPAFRAALTLARSEAGMRDQALSVLSAEAATDFSELRYDWSWLVGMACYAQAVATLGDRDAAAKLHMLLDPWRDQVAFNVFTVWGLVERLLGNLDRVLGRYDNAEKALVRAAERHEEMGAPIWLARTRLDLGRLLLERGQDTLRAGELLGQARASARDLGCASIERQAGALLGDPRRLA
jgi:DNA-binding SARP family transcriptional activator/tetratricopeptide (TPR) repeat protein